MRPFSQGVRTPTILQLDIMECGAACLAMILAHWGRWVALEEVREACGVSRDGSNAGNLVRAARKYGLEATGLRKDLDELQSVPLPCVLHWGFNHFVVLEAVHRSGVRINDPARGRRRVGREELDRCFTGMVLTFAPRGEFVREGATSSLLRALLERLSGSPDAALFVCLASALLIVPGIVLPGFARLFIDEYLVGRHLDWLRPTLFAFGVAILTQMALMSLQRRVLLHLEVRLGASFAQRFVWTLLNLPPRFFAQRLPGDLVARVATNQRVAQLIAGDLINVLVGMGTVLLFGVVMLTYDWTLAALAVGLGVANLIVAGAVWRWQENLARRSLQSQSRLAAITTNGLANIEMMKANCAESAFFNVWAAQQAEFINVQQQLNRGVLLSTTVPSLLSGVSNALILGVGATQVMRGRLTIGELVAFQTLAVGFYAPIRDFVNLGTRLRQASADLERLDDVLRAGAEVNGASAATAPREPAPGQQTGRLRRLSGHLEFRGVGFGYASLAPPYLVDVSFTVEPGMRVALVGRTGSGKSTLARLAAGLYAPAAGSILYDGHDLHSLDREVLASSLAFVEQQVNVFRGTFKDNLSLWDEGLELEHLIAAARDACLHETIAMRADGYLGRVEERGQNLSAGEQQRMEIARALAREPSVLILDEATSFLDPPTESEINEHLRRRGCACLIVAHRLSTVRDCDEIIVLDAGRVVERGTHAALMARGAEYARLVGES